MTARLPVLSGVAGILSGFAIVVTAAHAQNRGELLYSTHCLACHTAQMHWRASRAATDWTSLKAEVRKWQAAASLAWSEDDVLEVARYLNDSIYRFVDTRPTAARTSPTGSRALWCRLDALGSNVLGYVLATVKDQGASPNELTP